MWLSGFYTYRAVSTAIENCLAGKKSKAKYFEEPLLKKTEKQIEDDMTEEEKKAAIDQLFMNLQIMQANFELNKNETKSK